MRFECQTLIAFPRQERLLERTSVLCYTYIAPNVKRDGILSDQHA
jgi:hypothetical protein